MPFLDFKLLMPFHYLQKTTVEWADEFVGDCCGIQVCLEFVNECQSLKRKQIALSGRQARPKIQPNACSLLSARSNHLLRDGSAEIEKQATVSNRSAFVAG